MTTVATATRTLPASSARISPAKLAHVVLETANHGAVIAWYATVRQARVAFCFDPEQSIRDYEAGRALDDLVRRPPLPPDTSPMDMRPERPRA